MRSRLSQSPFPLVSAALAELGRDIRRARRRRSIAVAEMADRCLVRAPTYLKLEAGVPTVGLGVLAAALHALGMTDRLAELLSRDPQGEAMEERFLPRSVRRAGRDIPGIDS